MKPHKGRHRKTPRLGRKYGKQKCANTTATHKALTLQTAWMCKNDGLRKHENRLSRKEKAAQTYYLDGC